MWDLCVCGQPLNLPKGVCLHDNVIIVFQYCLSLTDMRGRIKDEHG